MNKKSVVKLSLGILIVVLLVTSLFLLLKNAGRVGANPDVQNFSVGSGDGYAYHTGENYPSVHDASTGTSADYTSETAIIGQNFTEGAPQVFEIWRGFFPVDTSALPDGATITNATLYFYVLEAYDAVDYCLTQTSQDFVKNLSEKDYDNAGTGDDCINIGSSGWYSITLSKLSWINKTGWTKIGLRSSRDIQTQQPAGAEYIVVNTANAADNQPYLEVEYSEEAGDNSPNVTLNLPEDDTQDNDGNVTFNCSAEDDWQLVNLTLYVWNSTGLYYSNTTNISGTINSSIWQLNEMPADNYLWNCLAYDNSSQSAWATSNFSLFIPNRVYDCQEISSAGVYVLQNNIEESGNGVCINITANNVIFDGQGHIIDGRKSPKTYGIYSSRKGNITLENFLVKEWETGIYLYQVVNSNVQNAASDSNVYGIYLNASDNNNLTEMSFLGNTLDVVISSSSNNIFINQTFNETTASFTYNGNFNLTSVASPPSDPDGYKNISKYINITGLGLVDYWLFLNISYSDDDLNGIDENTLKIWKYSGTWQEDGWNGSRVLDTTNNIVGVNITSFSIFAPLGQEEQGDQQPSVTLNSPPDGSTDTDGNITFNCTASDDINLTNVTLYGNFSGSWTSNGTNSSPENNTPVLFDRTLENGTYVWNCYACDNASQCAFASANRTLHVSIGGGEYTNISECGWINSPGEYRVNQPLVSNGTCITINASNVVLNCQYYYIHYGSDGGNSRYGIHILQDKENIEIKNCMISRNGTSGDEQFGIYAADRCRNLTIKDNVLQGGGIKFYYHPNSSSKILNNSITTESNNYKGILIDLSNNIDILNNTISTSGSSAYGFELKSSSSLKLENNNVSVASVNSTTIKAYNISNSSFRSNRLILSAISEPTSSVLLELSNYNNFSENILEMANTISGFSTFKLVGSNNTIFLNNTIITGASGQQLPTKIFDFNSSVNNFINITNLSIGGHPTRIFEFKGNVNSTQVFNLYVSETTPPDDILFNASSGIVNFTNVTFNKNAITFTADSTASLFVKWYVDVYVNDTNGSDVSGATVTGMPTRNQSVMNETFTNITGDDGFIEKQIVTEYKQNYSDIYNFTPHNFTANKKWYNSNSTEKNITTNMLDKTIFITLEPSVCREINESMTYNVPGDVLNSTEQCCIKITASNVIVNGQGHTIDGIDASNSYGICVGGSEALTNVTVINTRLTDWGHGVYYYNTSNSSITNVTANSNLYGIDIQYSTTINISNNNASYNSRDGIVLSASSSNNITNNILNSNGGSYYQGLRLTSSSNNNNIINNTVNSNNRGIYLSSSNNNNLSGNIVNSSNYEGIYLSQSSYNNLTGNNASSNSLQGILLNESSNNNLTNNIVNSNSGSGIVLNYNSNNNILVNNTANSNTNSWGIGLAYSQNNTLINNNASLNTWGGIYLHYANNNTLINNTAASNSGSGLGWGIHLHNSNYSNFTNNTAYGNNIADIRIQNNSLGNAFVNQTIAGNTLTTYQTKISFTYFRDVDIKGVTTPPSLPSGMQAINKYINATNQSTGAWLFLNVSYNSSDLGSADENTLRMWKYNTSWNEVSGSGVNTAQDYVYANITSFSVFAPLADVAAPNVTLNLPKNDTGTRNTTVVFNCSAYDASGVRNVTLYGNFSGTWQSNGTNTVSGTNVSTTFTRTLPEGNYLWNCYACDAWNNCSFASQNFSLIVDTTLPIPYFVLPTPDNASSRNYNYVYVNVSVNDTNKASAFIDWNYSLRGYWAFEETSGTTVYDNSSYGNHGTMYNMNFGTDNGTSGRTLTGKNGRGMMFDGINDFINISTGAFSSQYATIEVWVYPTTNTKDSYIVDSQINNNQFTLIWYPTSNTYKGFAVHFGSDGDWATSSSVASVNTWHHVVGTANGTHTKLYIDGQLISTVAEGTPAICSGGWDIGSTGSEKYFNGTIDEVRIWSRALSPEEINASYNNGLYRLENNFTNLNSTTYSYYAMAVDRAGNMNKTETRTVTIETSPPSIVFISPTPNNNSYISVNYTTIKVNVTDTQSNISSCILEWQNSNETMNITLYNKGAYCNATKTNLAQGTYTYKVYANDSAGNMNVSETRVLNIDLTNPVAYQGLPENGSMFTNRTISFSLKCTDNMQVNTLQLWGNFTGTWQANQTNSSPINNTWWNVSVTMPADGWYRWAAFCNDSSGRINMTENRTFYVDTVNPIVYLNKPANASSVYGLGASLVSTEFNCSAYDSGGLRNITLYGNWSGWGAKNSSNISGTSNSSLWYNNLNESSYVYNCLAYDLAGNSAFNATNYTFRVRTVPSVVFEEPTPTQGYAQDNVTINTTITDWNLGSASLDFDSSLRGYWAFNEESGSYAYDNSTFSNTGILVNGPARAAGIFGNALQFNGSNYVRVNNANSLNPSEAITIEAWFKTTASGTIVAKDYYSRGNFQNGYNLYLAESGGQKAIFFTLNCGGDQRTANALGNYSDGNWHHIAVTYDSTTDIENIVFYFDGIQLVSSTVCSGNIINTNNFLLIGRSNSTSFPGSFIGTIDEVKIHSRALTWGEINASMNNSRYRLYTTIYNLPAESEHNFSVIASDTDGNMNRTETLSFVVDITPPIITIISPENTTYNPSRVLANVSLSENGTNCSYSLDSGNNVTMTKLNETYFYRNISGLSIGQHNITFFCRDIAGNWNQSEYVYFRINDVPQVFFVPPSDDNGSSVGRNWTYVNTSIADSDEISSCILEWDGVNETMYINNEHYNETFMGVAITIQLNSSYDVADVYAKGDLSQYAFQMKWDISKLPTNVNIEQATLCVYWAAGSLIPVDNDVNFSRVNDQKWDEGINALQWNSQMLTNITLGNWSSVEPNTWGCVNVTDIIKEDYEQKNNFSSVRLQDPDYLMSLATGVIDDSGLYFGGPIAYLIAEDREGSLGWSPFYRPYLNITYSTGITYEAKANCYLNKSDENGLHTYKVYANDSYGKFGVSETRTIVFGNPVSECMNITAPDYYVLTQDLESNGTCIRILVDNVTLNCNNYMINYSVLQQGNAIWINSSNSLVKDCAIRQSNASVSEAHGINLYGGNGGQLNNITNNDFKVASQNAAAIYLDSNSNLVSENTIYETDYGVYVSEGVQNNVVRENTFYWNNIDVYIPQDAQTNILEENTHLITSVSAFALTPPPADLKVNSSSKPAPAPNGYEAANKYINVTASSGSQINVKMHYSDDDVLGIFEPSLAIWQSNHEWLTPSEIVEKCGEETGYKAVNTIDNNLDSYWAHSTEEQHYIIYDMGQLYNISAIRVYTNVSLDGAPCGAKVELSSDGGGSWLKVADENFTLAGLRWHEIEFNHTEANQIKLTLRTWRDDIKTCVENYRLSYFYEFDALTGEWQQQDSYVNGSENYVEANLSEFSIFGVFGLEGIDAPENFSIFLREDNVTVKLNWSQVDEADGYYLFYSDNVTEILQLDEFSNVSEHEHVTLIGSSNTTYNDTTADQVVKRFYAVAAYRGSGANQVRAFADDRLGKHTLTINSEDSIGHTSISFPLEQNISVDSIAAPNNFAYIYTINESANENWTYAYYYNEWKGELSILEFGKGYYFNNFDTSINITICGKIPTGNVTQKIYSEASIGHTYLGWESYTNGNISELLINPPNNFAYIYTINESANENWTYAYYYNEWKGPLTFFEATKGYYFNNFNEERNITYERNPH
ncbi:MAG: LamG-like jellyroll fold domain-containing protein [Candidatus Pacearchaeota archaeon]